MKNHDAPGSPPRFLNLMPHEAAGHIDSLCGQFIHVHSQGYFKRAGNMEVFEGAFYWFNHEDDLKDSILNGWFPLVRNIHNAEFLADAAKLEAHLWQAGEIGDIIRNVSGQFFNKSGFIWCGNVISLLSGEQPFEKQFRKEFREWISMIEPNSRYSQNDERLKSGVHIFTGSVSSGDTPVQTETLSLAPDLLDYLNRFFSSPVKMPVFDETNFSLHA